MEILFLLGLILVITLILPWVHAVKISSLRDDLSRLEDKVSKMRGTAIVNETVEDVRRSVASHHAPEKYYADNFTKVKDTIDPHTMVEHEKPQVPLPEDLEYYQEKMHEPESYHEEYLEKTPAKERTEFNFGAKLPVWTGAISLIFAAFFLVKYSLEAGLLGPMARVSIATISGIAMIFIGNVIIRRPHIANFERIAQGLTGAGIVSIYGALYAAVNLYAMFQPAVGFVGMMMVTVIAVISSLRIGQPIAVFALIGGLLTPALIQSSEPNSIVLFGYLFLLFAGFSFIMVRKAWWGLWLFSLGGVFSWTGLWLLFSFRPEDAFYMLLLQVAVVSLTISMLRKYIFSSSDDKSISAENGERMSHVIISAGIAGIAATILILSMQMTISLFDWGVLGLLGLAVMTLTYFRPALYQTGLWAVMALHLVLYGIWIGDVSPLERDLVLAGSALLYCVLPYFLIKNVPNPTSFAGVQLVSAACLYGLVYAFFGINETILAYVGLAIAALWVGQTHLIQRNNDIRSDVQNILMGMYSFAASALISVGFSLLLPKEYLPIAFSLQAMATMWIYTKTRISALDIIAGILTSIFIVLQHEQILLFSSLIWSSVVDSHISNVVTNYKLENPFLGLALPAIALISGAAIRSNDGPVNKTLMSVIAGAGGAASIAFFYYLIRDLYNENMSFAVQASFVERATITFAIVSAGILILQTRKESLIKLGAILFHIFAVRVIWFDLIIHNPYFDRGQNVGDVTIFNGITLTYLGAILAIIYMLREKLMDMGSGMKLSYHILLTALFMAFISLTVRHGYHGESLYSGNGMNPMELYSYSVVWLLSGLALLAYGIMKSSHNIRIFSFAVISITVLKVFLIDAGNLEGLYRVFSFFGLGVSLISLSYFYTRFVKFEAVSEEKTNGI